MHVACTGSRVLRVVARQHRKGKRNAGSRMGKKADNKRVRYLVQAC